MGRFRSVYGKPLGRGGDPARFGTSRTHHKDIPADTAEYQESRGYHIPAKKGAARRDADIFYSDDVISKADTSKAGPSKADPSKAVIPPKNRPREPSALRASLDSL